MVQLTEILKQPKLQVALDLTSIDRAVAIAKVAWDNGAEILEAGTPLIKHEGIYAVKVLRERFPDAIIVADMKTMDTGSLETRIAYEGGADISTVLAVADDSTILDALVFAKKHGLLIAVDLISHPNPKERIAQLNNMNIDILGVHLGIDVQRKFGITVADISHIVEYARKNFEGAIAVAGGIKPGKIKPLIQAGANIIIVGSAITKAEDPGEITRIIVKEMKRASR